MDERIPEILTAITLLLIGIFLAFGNVVSFLRLDSESLSLITRSLSWLIFIFALATAIVLLKDAMKKRDDED